MSKLTAWEVVSDVLRLLKKHSVAGIDTLTLNNLAAKRIKELGAASFNKGYHPKWAPTPFPAEVCISINDEIAHGIPNANRFLKEGDLVNFDIGVKKDGICGDAALTVPVGEVDQRKRMLLKQAKKALYAGIEKVKPGNTVRDVARAIDDVARHKGFVVNRNFTGHSIGKEMHEEPLIVLTDNFDPNDKAYYLTWNDHLNVEFKEGMMLCLEPMLTEGDRYGIPEKNGWTVRTRNHKPSCMFEHQLLVTATGCKILTTHID